MPQKNSGNGGPPKWSILPRDDPTEPEPPPVVVTPPLTLCELAKKTLENALENWANASGRSYSGYKIATRSVTYTTQADAARAVDAAINMVVKFCGPGALPGGLEEWGGAARRAIPSDV